MYLIKFCKTKTFLSAISLVMVLAMLNMGLGFHALAGSRAAKAYTGEEIFSGINFGKGEVAKLFPEIWKSFHTNNKDSLRAFDLLREKVVAEIKASDPTFMERYGREMQSGDHLRIDGALKESSAKITSAMMKIGTMNSKGELVGSKKLANKIGCSKVAICVVAVFAAVVKHALTVDAAIAAYVLAAASAIAVWKWTYFFNDDNKVSPQSPTTSRLFREQFVNSVAERLAVNS